MPHKQNVMIIAKFPQNERTPYASKMKNEKAKAPQSNIWRHPQQNDDSAKLKKPSRAEFVTRTHQFLSKKRKGVSAK